MMKRAILFRFHKEFDVCKNHIELFRKFNPGVSIYGMYGGTDEDWNLARLLPLDYVWNVPVKSSRWKWKNGDLAAALWFKEIGHTFEFDMLHQFAWDTLLFASVNDYYKDFVDGVVLKGIIPLKSIYDTWIWTSGKPGRQEWLKLLDFVNKNYSYRQEPLACLFLGACVSRDFIRRYSEVVLPSDFCNDETRVPLFAQAFGIPIHSAGKMDSYCRLGKKELSKEDVLSGWRKGIVLFNPVVSVFPLENLD